MNRSETNLKDMDMFKIRILAVCSCVYLFRQITYCNGRILIQWVCILSINFVKVKHDWAFFLFGNKYFGNYLTYSWQSHSHIAGARWVHLRIKVSWWETKDQWNKPCTYTVEMCSRIECNLSELLCVDQTLPAFTCSLHTRNYTADNVCRILCKQWSALKSITDRFIWDLRKRPTKLGCLQLP